MSSTVIVLQFVSGLKSRHTQVQNKAAHELLIYVKTELREMSQEELSLFFEVFNHHIFEMIASTDNSEKKGGVLAISKYRLSSHSAAGLTPRIHYMWPNHLPFTFPYLKIT